MEGISLLRKTVRWKVSSSLKEQTHKVSLSAACSVVSVYSFVINNVAKKKKCLQCIWLLCTDFFRSLSFLDGSIMNDPWCIDNRMLLRTRTSLSVLMLAWGSTLRCKSIKCSDNFISLSHLRLHRHESSKDTSTPSKMISVFVCLLLGLAFTEGEEQLFYSASCQQLSYSFSSFEVEWSNMKPYIYNSTAAKPTGW